MIVRPCRTRAQNAFTRADSNAVSTITVMARNVIVKSANCGCDAKYERSNAFSFEKSGGLGKTPCVKAKTIASTLTRMSKSVATVIAAVTVGKVERSIEALVRKIWMMFAAPPGTTFLKPTAATYAPQISRHRKRSAG